MAVPATVRPTLRGTKLTLGFGLVNIPVVMKPLAETQRPIPGKGMCPEHGPTLSQVSVCSKGEPGEHLVPNDEKQTGYPHPDSGDLVVVDPVTWKALNEPRTGLAAIEKFVDDAIDPAFIDKTYMVCEQPGHAQTFDLLAAVLDAEGKAAVTTAVLSKQTAMLVFRFSPEFGCVLAHTIRYEQQLRYDDVQLVVAAAKERPDVDAKQLAAAKMLFAALEGEFDAGEAQDLLTTARQEAIRAIAEGQEVSVPTVAEPAPTSADDLLATLLASVPQKPKAPAKKAAPRKRAAKVAA